MTENERKQQLSIAYVHALASFAGFTCQREGVDEDSVDVVIGARGFIHEQAVVRSPKIEVQLKATSLDCLRSDHLAFPLTIKNYDELRLRSCLPRYLFVLHLPQEETEWLEVSETRMMSRNCVYWMSLAGSPRSTNKTNITVKVPRLQRLNLRALRTLVENAALENTR